MSQDMLVAPPQAQGWTHVWAGGREQLPITDAQAEALVWIGLIRYSGDYRVYRPVWGVSLETVKRALA